jgi:hypothetical protein
MKIHEIKLVVDGVTKDYAFAFSKKEEAAAEQGYLDKQLFLDTAKQNTIKKLIAKGHLVQVSE